MGNSKQTQFQGLAVDYSVQAHGLMLAAAPAIDRDSFAAESIGQSVGLVDGGRRGLFVEVYGFTYRRVTMLLERRLHSDMPLRLDVVGSLEEPANRGGDFGQFLDAARPGNLSFKPHAVKPAFGSYLLKERIYLQHSRTVQDLADKY